MARQKRTRKRQAGQADPAAPVIRSTLHLVMAGRKSARHQPRNEKRAAQKLRRDLEQD